MSRTTPPAERLLNLVIALLNTSSRMTKEQIRAGVVGYESQTTEAFERMFERDKDALRELGIPVQTVTHHGFTDEIGYRIDPETYTLGDLELSPAELAVLSLASTFWRDATLTQDANRAITKLRAVASVGGQDDLAAGLLPRVQPAGPGLPVLLDAIIERRAVRFTYRAAYTGEVTEREVEPWQVRTEGAGWYLVGHDRSRGEPRSYRLNRIQSTVRAVGAPGAFEIPADALERAGQGGGDDGVQGEREAVLAVVPERAGALRARALPPRDSDAGRVPDRDVVRVPFRSAMELGYEIAGYGPAVLVLDPPELRDVVVRRLRDVVELGQVADDAVAAREEHRG